MPSCPLRALHLLESSVARAPGLWPVPVCGSVREWRPLSGLQRSHGQATGLWLVSGHGEERLRERAAVGLSAHLGLRGDAGVGRLWLGCRESTGARGRASILSPAAPTPRRFIHQVNRAAVTIQRWFRRQVRRRRAGAARLEHLLASKQKVSVECEPGGQDAGQRPGVPAMRRGVSGTSGIPAWDCPVGLYPAQRPGFLPAPSHSLGVRTYLPISSTLCRAVRAGFRLQGPGS